MPRHQTTSSPADPGKLARVQRLLARVRGAAQPAASPATPLERLQEARRRIDTLDHEVVRLLAARASLVREAFAAKQLLRRTVVDPGRERSMLAMRRQWASARGLDADAVATIFRAVIAFSCALQGVKP